MAQEKSVIQAEYRKRKAKSGLKQIVLYLPEQLAEELKAEAKQQGVTRSDVVVARLRQPRPVESVTSDARVQPVARGEESRMYNIAYASGILGLDKVVDNGQAMVKALQTLKDGLNEAEEHFSKGSEIKATKSNARHLRSFAKAACAIAKATGKAPVSYYFGRIAEKLHQAAESTERRRVGN